MARGGAKDAGKRAQTARGGAGRAGGACRSSGGARPAAEPGGGAAARGHAGAVAEVERLQSEWTCSARPLWAGSGMGS